MSAGIKMQLGAAVETVHGTRVAPSKFFEVIDTTGVDFTRNFYVSRGLGGGLWKKRRVQTTRFGGGGWNMEVPSAGFGFWLDKLHPNAVVPVQQAATPAYLQTHNLSGAPTKSFTMQIGVPDAGDVVRPFDYLGCMLAGGEWSWDPGSVLMFRPNLVVKDLKTDQSLATLTPPADYGLFSFKGGSVTIGGATVADIIGGGRIALGFPLRTDAFALGSDGTMMKPRATDRPTIGGEVTADFTDMTHYNRVVNGTLADVVLKFEGATISGAYKETIEFTLPDQGFNGPPPQVGGPGPVTQTIRFEDASTTGDVPSIKYTSTDVTV